MAGETEALIKALQGPGNIGMPGSEVYPPDAGSNNVLADAWNADLASKIPASPNRNSLINALKGTLSNNSPIATAKHVYEDAKRPVMGVKHLMDIAATAPVGVPTEEMTPEQQAHAKELAKASFSTTMDLAGLGRSGVQKNSAGALGGDLASNIDRDAMNRAKEDIMRYKHPEDIWNKHMFMVDPANFKWTTEFPDNKMALHHLGAQGPASKIISHPDLYGNYSVLKDMPVITKRDGGTSGSFYPPNVERPGSPYRMEVSAPDLAAARDPAAHEFVHAVQHLQGWQNGANAGHMQQLMKEFASGKNPDTLQHLNPKWLEALSSFEDPGGALYATNVGENQAWNVGTNRLNFSPTERRDTPLWKTQNLPYRHQTYWDPQGNLRHLEDPQYPGPFGAYISALMNYGTKK